MKTILFISAFTMLAAGTYGFYDAFSEWKQGHSIQFSNESRMDVKKIISTTKTIQATKTIVSNAEIATKVNPPKVKLPIISINKVDYSLSDYSELYSRAAPMRISKIENDTLEALNGDTLMNEEVEIIETSKIEK